MPYYLETLANGVMGGKDVFGIVKERDVGVKISVF